MKLLLEIFCCILLTAGFSYLIYHHIKLRTSIRASLIEAEQFVLECENSRHKHINMMKRLLGNLENTEPMFKKLEDAVVKIDYTNWKGERSFRYIVPVKCFFGSNEWHTAPQWLLEATDVEKNALRTFAIKDIHSFEIGIWI